VVVVVVGVVELSMSYSEVKKALINILVASFLCVKKIFKELFNFISILNDINFNKKVFLNSSLDNMVQIMINYFISRKTKTQLREKINYSSLN
jgi:hypothetical protein